MDQSLLAQQIRADGQHKTTGPWLAKDNPWDLIRPEWTYPVEIGDHTLLPEARGQLCCCLLTLNPGVLPSTGRRLQNGMQLP